MKKLILIAILIPQFAMASVEYKLESGKTEFLAVGNPGFLKINGKGEGPTGKMTVENGMLDGEVTLKLDTLDTGMSLRNQHMKEKYLQTGEFPEAKLIISKFKLPADWSIKKPEFSSKAVPAEIIVHGKKKPIQLQVTIDKNAKIKSHFELKITDFAIEIPSFMGVTVADQVKVDVESNLKAI